MQTAVSGAHQGDGNPNLDVSTRLRLGLPPLGCQATGYPFQGSRRLHPSSPSTEATKGEKCLRCWRQASGYIFFFPFLASWRHFSGAFFKYDKASVFTTHILWTLSVPCCQRSRIRCYYLNAYWYTYTIVWEMRSDIIIICVNSLRYIGHISNDKYKWMWA